MPQIIYVDLVGLRETAAVDALLAGVRRARAKPTIAPGFPEMAPRAVLKPPRFPGALAPIWNVPFTHNPNFTGRGGLLEALHCAPGSGRHAAHERALRIFQKFLGEDHLRTVIVRRNLESLGG